MKKYVFIIISLFFVFTITDVMAEDFEITVKKKKMHAMKNIGDYHVKAKYQFVEKEWKEIDVDTEGRSETTAGARVKARVQKQIRDMIKNNEIDRKTGKEYKKMVSKTFEVISCTKN